MIHPSGFETTDYEPSECYEPRKAQIEDAARRAKDQYVPYQKPLPLMFWLLGLGGLLSLIWILVS